MYNLSMNNTVWRKYRDVLRFSLTFTIFFFVIKTDKRKVCTNLDETLLD